MVNILEYKGWVIDTGGWLHDDVRQLWTMKYIATNDNSVLQYTAFIYDYDMAIGISSIIREHKHQEAIMALQNAIDNPPVREPLDIIMEADALLKLIRT